MFGHSLGAQACGYVGDRVQKAFGEPLPIIHALDPAEPYFKNTPPEVCLTPDDAEVVSVIHSDATQFLSGGLHGLGVSYPVGHLDFWPDNGTAHPGCESGLLDQIDDNGGLWEGLRHFVVFDHLRAVDFFEASLEQACEFRSYACDAWMDFDQGYCLESWSGGICRKWVGILLNISNTCQK